MDYYKKGRKYLNRGRIHIAKESFEKGTSSGCSKCVYGLFALKMSTCEDARFEYENFMYKIDDIQKKAKNGDSDSCFIIGRSFETGCSGECDFKKAIYWYKKAAELGNVDAMFNLGCIYCYDENSANFEKGIHYFKLAAKHNLKESQFNLGHIYEIKEKKERAFYWYKRARRGGKREMKEKYLLFKSSLFQN